MQSEQAHSVMTKNSDILEVMSELSLFIKMLMIRDCDDPKKLKRHIKYWSTKVKNLTNFPLGSEVDRRYVDMFEKLVAYTSARLEYAQAKLDGRVVVSNTKQEP